MKKITYSVRLLLIPICFVGVGKIRAQNVGINSTGAAPDVSAVLDVSASDKGMLVPRIALNGTNDVTTIASPANSLLVYNTQTASDVTPGYYYFDSASSTWQRLASGAIVGTDDQNISGSVLSGTILTIGIEGGNSETIDLSSLQDGTGTDSQTLSLSGNTLSISGGNNVILADNVNDADADPTNEIEIPTGGSNGQVLSTDGSGNYSWITDDNGTDNQDLSLSGNILSLTNDGTTVDLSNYLDNTDDQNLTSSVSGGNATVNISGGTGTTFSINDADADPSNEYNTGMNLTGNSLNVIDGGGTQTVDLSLLKDHDWYEIGGTAQPDNINDSIYTMGNVGIGINNPTQKLDVDGFVQSDHDYYTTVTFPAGYSVGDYIEFVQSQPISARASGMYEISISGIVANHASAATFRVSSSHANRYNQWRELPIIGNNGYVGLGQNFTVDMNPNGSGNPIFRVRAIATTGNTSTQNYVLNIRVKSINFNSGWTLLANSGSGGTIDGYAKMTESWMLTTGLLHQNTPSNIAISAISNGNVGIGTDTPTEKLSIKGVLSEYGAGLDGSVYEKFTLYTDQTNQLLFEAPKPGNSSVNRYDYYFSHRGDGHTNSRMVIKGATGNVGIGTTAPSQRLHVVGNILASGTITSSDRRYKREIRAINNALEVVAGINPVSYYFKTKEYKEGQFDDQLHFGVIAQEIEQVLPNIVYTDNNGYKAVNYTDLIPVLIKAIQEQQKEIEALKIQINN